MYAYVCPVQLHFVIQKMKTITHIFLKVLIIVYCIILMLLTLVFGAIRNI